MTRAQQAISRGVVLIGLAWAALGLAPGLRAAEALPPTNKVVVIAVQNRVEITRRGAEHPDPARVGQDLEPGDRGRTYEKSGVTLRLTDLSVVRIRENSLFEIQAPPAPNRKARFSLIQGLSYFFSREKPLEIQIHTRTAVAAIRGTEFAVQQEEDGRTVFTLFDGVIELSNLQGDTITLTNREQGTVQPGQPPRKTASLEASNIIQWFLYYPAVLDLDELALSAEEQQILAASLNAWRQGNLLGAMANYPAGRTPASSAERLYQAALFLAVGNLDQAAPLLNSLARSSDLSTHRVAALAVALQKLCAAVQGQPVLSTWTPSASARLATERLAESYYQQSRARLGEALQAAQTAVRLSTNFAYGWARVATLEFCFGRNHAAKAALARSLALAPRNAQALALQGFLLAADNRLSEGIVWFDKAIAADGLLGDAWLGRGLCLIRQGRREAGRADLQTATALEPTRSFLRSYLAKAWSETGHDALAAKELELAKKLDAKDPTPWLYSALFNREQTRINPAVTDLERSMELNDNRGVYRSQFLREQDRAVRGSSLANIYLSAGLTDFSVREAARAVGYDYGNYSAHQFLAESYDALRDPTRFNLRYETPWFNEWLLSTLLSPVGGTPLAQHISQQEYTRFFERDRLGLATQTEYRSDGQVREVASQFGNYGSVGYALDVDCQHNDGVRPNNHLDRLEFYGTIKYELTPQDSLLFLTKLQDYHSGDNFQYYDPTQEARLKWHFNEYQTPGALVGGYHHEWAPGIHTLLLGGRLANDQRVGDPDASAFWVLRNPANNNITFLSSPGFDFSYRSKFDIYSGELSQIVQTDRHTFIVGGRFQSGAFTTYDLLHLAPRSAGLALLFPNPPAADALETSFERVSGYAYWTWEIIPHLLATPGLAYDTMRHPRNFRSPPVNRAEQDTDQFGPKAGLVWNPIPALTLRGAYTRSLSGVSFDESYCLEPSQLAGFTHTFRDLIPEPLVGAVSGAKSETAGLGLDLKLKSRTYLTLQGELLQVKAGQTLGVFETMLGSLSAHPAALNQNLSYRERSFSVALNQLVANEWALGAGYKFTRAELEQSLPEVPLTVFGKARQQDQGDLHRCNLFALYNHPTGWFVRAELNWYLQDSSVRTYPNGLAAEKAYPREEFPQLNLLVGYRLKHQRGELTLGVLNLTGEDYHLKPINLYEESPRSRVFYARLRLRF